MRSFLLTGIGDYLGIHCKHAYAHSTAEGIKALPGVLKGSDMALFSVFRALDLSITIRPKLNILYQDLYEETSDYNETEANDAYLGSKLHTIVFTEAGGYDGADWKYIVSRFPGAWEKVNWLTNPPFRYDEDQNVGFVHLTVCHQGLSIVRSG